MCIKKLEKFAEKIQKYVSKNIVLKSISVIIGFYLISLSLSNIFILFISNGLSEIVSYFLNFIMLATGHALLMFSDKKFENIFVLFSIAIVLLIISSMYYFSGLSQSDLTKFPIYPSFYFQNDIAINNIECKNMVLPDRDIPTENDYFSCKMYIESKDTNITFDIKEINILDYYIPFQTETKNITYCFSFNGTERTSYVPYNRPVECLLKFPVGNVGTHEKRIEFTFISYKTGNEKFVLSYPFRYNSLSDSQYREVKDYIPTIIFAGSAAIFSSIAFIKGFMEIWDRKIRSKRKKCPKCGKTYESD